MIVFQRPRCFALAMLAGAVLLCCLLAGPVVGAGAAAAAADRVDLSVIWQDGKPQTRVVVGDLPAELPVPPSVAWSLLDPQDKPLAGGEVKLARIDGTWQAAIPLDAIKDPKKTHRLEVSLGDAVASLDYAARATIVGEAASVPWYAIVGEGIWPDRSVAFIVSLPGDRSAQPRDIPVALTVRDGDDAVAFQRELRLPPAADRSVHRIDLAPDIAASVGPYLAEIDIDSEVHGLSFRTQERFAQACAEIPLSSFERGQRGDWFTADGQPQSYRSLQFYYSGHLQDLQQRDYPRIGYDPAEKHAGRQSLRIGYESGKPAHVWSQQVLPGKPTALSIWVKGNNTADELLVSFEDHINFSLPAWQRNANFSESKVCTLDFEGWRRFTVPVLGAGLQASGSKGSTTDIDAPVKILAVSVRTTVAKGMQAGEPRQIWLDDLSVQTQSPENGRLSLELGSNRADVSLAKDAVMVVSLGNGRGVDLPRGRLSLTARDAEGQAVWTQTLDLPAKAGQFTSVEVPLEELARKPVGGPFDIDATFTDASVPGARITGRQTWKFSRQAAVVHDFEHRETYSGYAPGAVTTSRATVVDGGADGSKGSLALNVVPGQADNSVLLHPALPGKLDWVELMVHGGPHPVTLQPWFIDAGATGVWLRRHNLFWAEPITVDWQGWRKVTVACPPIPTGHAEKSRSFLFEPAYPLNLAFNAQATGDQPVEVRIDNVRAVTHLPRDEWHRIEIEYPDESRMHAPGAPLTAIVTNFGSEPATFAVSFQLRQAQGFVARQGTMPLEIKAGERRHVTLIDSLSPGVYDLELTGVGPQPVRGPLAVLPAAGFFGPQPATMLGDPLALRRQLGFTNERIYLDWDNVEPAPYVRHFTWFEMESGKRRELPVMPAELRPLAEAKEKTAAAVPAAVTTVTALQVEVGKRAAARQQAARNVEAAQKNVDAAAAELAPLAATDQAAAMAVRESEEILAKARLDHAEAVKLVAEKTAEIQRLKDAPEPSAETPLPKTLEMLAAELAAAQKTVEQSQAGMTEREKALAPLTANRAKTRQAAEAIEKKLAAARTAFENERLPLAAAEQAIRDTEKAIAQAAVDHARLQAEAVAAAKAFEAAKLPFSLALDPVVGVAADRAGPEAREALTKGVYSRFIPNILQVPDRLIDWSLFVRELQREYRGRFDRWVFWENPDLDQAPQNIPPERYRPLLEIFHRWVKLYSPRSRVIAGGFNFDKAIEYLRKIPDPQTLPFDEIALQVNLGELSPEKGDMEGFLDDLDDLLKLRETRRTVSITELDWGIGPLVSPVEQAAYHARAALLLHSRAAAAHQFQLVNTGFALDGYGVFYRLPYGNSGDLQTFKPSYVPKPAYFALMETRRFLSQWQYVTSVSLADRSLDDQRAFVYRNGRQQLATVIWRAVDGERIYTVPPAWRGADIRDAFNIPADATAGLRVTPLPLFITLPAGYQLDQLLEDLRRLAAADGSHPVWLDLHLAAADSRTRCNYQAQGQLTLADHGGQLPGSRTVREPFVAGIQQEQFTFVAPQAGAALLRRRWHFDGIGQVLQVSLNGGAEQTWNLGPGQDNALGVRETMFVLSGCRAGENRVSIRYGAPGNAAGYRVEPLAGDEVPLSRLGAINARQSRGRFLNHTNAAGSPLSIGKTTYDDGIGTHATSFIEYPLDGLFERFEATVGIDGSTEGRGSVVFRVYVDGKLRADSGVVNGFDVAKTLTVDGLDKAGRMILSVTDAGDGDRNDLANWVDGKLVLKTRTKTEK